ncbi:MAG: HAD family hydrolase [Nocardioidaceae bacterium]
MPTAETVARLRPTATVGRTTVSRARFDAAVFDLDGVITDTAALHEAAWARMFDETLPDGPAFTAEDYRAFVDGKAREDGVTGYLSARGITAEPARVRDLAARKDRYFRQLLAECGPGVIASSVDLVHRLRAAGLTVAVATASRNGARVLERAGLADLFAVRVDGVVADRLHLPGKPDPALFLEAARRLDTPPHRIVLVEDSRAGVTAARRGGFGLVVGLDRAGRGGLGAAGADVVVADLATLQVTTGTP